MIRRAPLSKIWKEIRRIGRQSASVPKLVGNLLLTTVYYDLVLSKRRRITPGHIALGEKVAVIVIFPSSGLVKSHHFLIDYFLQKGFSPVIVSNLALTDSERSELLEKCHVCIERPNFGYDFGGYRDGILWLNTQLASMSQLIIINDSSWFPLPGGSDWISDIARLNVDYTGASSHYAVKTPDPERFEDFEWSYDTKQRNFHYGSYALSISSRILRDPKFLTFWRKMKLSNKKHHVVRRGEIGLTKWVKVNEYTHAATLDIINLEADLKLLSDSRIEEIANNLVIHESFEMQMVKHRVVRLRNATRSMMEKLIVAGVSRQGASYTLADYSIHEMHFPFLKKSPLMGMPDGAQVVLRLAQNLPGEFGSVIRNEAGDLYWRRWHKELSNRDNKSERPTGISKEDFLRSLASKKFTLNSEEDSLGFVAAFGDIPYGRYQPWLGYYRTIARSLIRKYRPETVIDAGCGWGLLVEALHDRGVDARGFDLSLEAISNARDDMKQYVFQHSLLEPVPLVDGKKYDLAVCLEVAEYLAPEDTAKAIKNLCAASNRIVFAATPYEFKSQKIRNVRSTSEWLDVFVKEGFSPVSTAAAKPIAPYAFVVERRR
jgi:Rhamnan synthesis protein F/Methyltransferase domain